MPCATAVVNSRQDLGYLRELAPTGGNTRTYDVVRVDGSENKVGVAQAQARDLLLGQGVCELGEANQTRAELALASIPIVT